MYVKVTDGNGNPVPGVAVSWVVTFGGGVLSSNGTQTDQTTTDSTGIAVETYFGNNNNGTYSPATPFVQSTITATLATGPSVTFYETQAFAVDVSSSILIQLGSPTSTPPCAACTVAPGETLKGNAGSPANSQFQVLAYAPGSAIPVVPNVSFQLISDQLSPTISCATGAGADPGSVLTDATGSATCTAIMGSTTGFGTFHGLIGGVKSLGYNQGGPSTGYYPTGTFGLQVLPGVPSSLTIVSGNNQSGFPGQGIPAALVAAVGDSAGNPLAGQAVVWSVSPSGSATLSNTTTSSDANGRVQTSVSLAPSAAGLITVKAALASNPNISAVFGVTANVQVTGLQIVSGNNQTAIVNSAFASPLVVQLTSSSGFPASGVPVGFVISGPASLSSSTANTDTTGRASVSVIAGSFPGAVSVTASSSGFSQTFSLTVVPQGPQLSSSSFYNGADFQPGSISPCGVATIIAPGVAAGIQGTAAYSGVGALPYTLGNDQVTFAGAQAPIYNVANLNGQQQVTVQVPCSVTPGSVPVVVSVGGGTGSVNVNVLPASPGLFLTRFSTTAQIPVLERPDGSFVSPTNPAVHGETLIAYVTGLGAMSPSVATNALPAPGSSTKALGTVVVGMNANGVPFIGSAASTDIVGVETVTFVVPSNTPAGTSTFSITVIPQGSSTGYNTALGFFPVQ